VFHAKETDTPERILERLFMSDNKHGDVLARLDAKNAAIRAMEMRAKLDEAEERKDQAAWFAKTKKHQVHVGKGRVLDISGKQMQVVRKGHGG
jgi:multidrug resistance efflux pump